jgi:hypothetical protein
MRFRKLRIAWSVLWGLACVLLIVLWVRSYTWLEGIDIPIATNRALQFGSLPGAFAVALRTVPEEFKVVRRPVEEWRKLHKGPSQWWGGMMRSQSTKAVYLPFWLLVSCAAIFAAVPWKGQLRDRFSLRTLLIVMTFFGLLLGLVVYASR